MTTQRSGWTSRALPRTSFTNPYVTNPAPTPFVIEYVNGITMMISAAESYSCSEIINLSSGVETSIRDVADHLRATTGFDGEIVWNTSRPDGQLRRCFDISKAKRELGFEARVDIRSGLERTARWYQANMNAPELRR